MFAIYRFQDLNYHYDFSLIKKGFPDYATAVAFKKELDDGDFSSEYLGHELVFCEELETHHNAEVNIRWDRKHMHDAYNELVNKYFGDTK